MKSLKVYFNNAIIVLSILMISNTLSAELKPFEWNDAMKFKGLRSHDISYDGQWLAWEARPDRGDGEVVFQNVWVDSISFKVERGAAPIISYDNKWGAFYLRGKAVEIENAKSPKDRPKNKLNIISLNDGKITEYDEVNKFEFSNDAQWLCFKHFDDESIKKDGKIKNKPIGSKFVLKHLESGTDIVIDFVNEYVLESASHYLMYSISAPDGKKDGIYFRDLNKPFAPEKVIDARENHYFGNFAFNTDVDKIAYLTSALDKEGEPLDNDLKAYNLRNGLMQTIIDTNNFPSFLYIPHKKNKLEWTMDNNRIFFGYRFTSEKDTTKDEDIKFTDSTFFSIDSIRMKKDLKMWHWDDTRIVPHQEKWWQQNKDRTYMAVYDFDRANYTTLGDSIITSVEISENKYYTIGYDDTKYQKEILYHGWFFDLYLLNMITGQKKLIETRLEEKAHISPNGDFVLYFKQGYWYIHFTRDDLTKHLTKDILDFNFYDEEWDRPANPPSYGFGGFVKGAKSFMLYDRYDIWQFNVVGNEVNGINLTDAIGRQDDIKFRIINLDRDKKYYVKQEVFYVNGFHNKEKWNGIYELEISLIGPIQKLQEDGFRYSLKAQSEDKNNFLFTKENFAEYPDLWVAGYEFDSLKQVSHLNEQTEDYLWGYTELVEWESELGDPHQGYIILPDNYNPDKKYPMIVFFYEQMSDNAYSFWQPRIFHLISYPNYFPDDYIFFLPDIKYYEGNPGYDALASINSGCQHLIDKGIADPDKIGLQGHSWSAYQAALMITQTDMYAAAVIGAPVGNMTSAYSGIRTGSGLARQFQYENYQSRIGGNLWDSLDNYINNSPVFKAPAANTPMLIFHGDIDDAVPFSQAVELFLAFKRLDKECILLEYTGEPHHPRKYENKLDYAIRMKEFYDHYLLGKPAAKWILEGKIYKGK